MSEQELRDILMALLTSEPGSLSSLTSTSLRRLIRFLRDGESLCTHKDQGLSAGPALFMLSWLL